MDNHAIKRSSIAFMNAPIDPTPSPMELAGSTPALPCPVCKTLAPAVVVKRIHIYHCCPACACVFTPRIDEKVIQNENTGVPTRHQRDIDAVRLQRLIAALGRSVETVIDFGCGEGQTMKFIQSQGIKVIGIDQNTTLQLKDVADESVDGIMMIEVIEHLYDPHVVFAQFNRVLKPRSVVYVESSFTNQKKLATWSYLDPAIGHCTVHSLRSMGLLAEKNGFRISWMNANTCCFTRKSVVEHLAVAAPPKRTSLSGLTHLHIGHHFQSAGNIGDANRLARNVDCNSDKQAERILFVRTDSIGDAVLASSMLEPIRKKYPQAKLAVLCQQQVAELYLASPWVDSIICFNGKTIDEPAEQKQILSEIAEFHPDLILNSIRSRFTLSDILTLNFREARHVAIESDAINQTEADREKAASQYAQIIPSSGAWKPELERHRDFLAGLGIEAVALKPVVWTSPDDEALADQFFKLHQLDAARTIALFPGAKDECRIYPHFAEAVKSLKGYQFLIFGGAEVKDIAQRLAVKLPGPSINLAGKATLREMAALFRRCRLYVGAESSGAHIACAVGLPNVVVLGGGHCGRFMPYSPLTSLACLPLDCYGCNWTCKFSKVHCVKDLDPAVVAAAISQTLAGLSARPRIFYQAGAQTISQSDGPKWKQEQAFFGPTDAEFITVATEPKLSPKMNAPKSPAIFIPRPLPKISIVTPSFNQGEYLEECIDSILSQNYPGLEYIVMDGGSRDRSVEIIKRHAKHLTHWQSAPDGGQYHAIQDGLVRTTGEIMFWLNSSDKLHPGSLDIVSQIFAQRLDVDWLMGRPTSWNEAGLLTDVAAEIPRWSRELYLTLQPRDKYIQQESTFWRRSLWDRSGGRLDLKLKHAADFELWARFFHFAQLHSVDALLGGFRSHTGQKTAVIMNDYLAEVNAVVERELPLFQSEAGKKSLSAPPLIDLSGIDRTASRITAENFSYFTYSKQPHFKFFRDNDVELYHRAVDLRDCDLKEYQDLLVYTFIKDNVPPGSKILDVGGGDSRVLRALKHDYECWNLDKLEGLGNGLKEIDATGCRLVKDYIGAFSRELPENYFDFVFSISVFEHLDENEENFRNVCLDLDRIMKPGAFSLHCLDVVQHTNIWTNQALPFFFENIRTVNQSIPLQQLRLDPHTFYMPETAYDRLWKHVTKKNYADFGRPLSCNVLWQKTDQTFRRALSLAKSGNFKEEILLIPETPTGSDPLVSVIVSAFKSEQFIRACLENLTRQKIFNRCEIIVVDSGSPENERAIVAEFQQKFPNIRYVRTPRETIYGAWNRGLALARGRYWVNANTDDGLRADALEILAAAMEQHADCALAYADTAWTTKPNDTFPSANVFKTVKYPNYAPTETLFYCITGCLQFWRTESLRRLGGFDASLKCAGDYEATLKMMAAKMNAVHVPEALSLFFQNPKGLTQGDNGAAAEHDETMNRYRANLCVENIFRVEPGSPTSAARVWAALGIYASKFSVPWEDKPIENTDFAFDCFRKALDFEPENEAAGMSLVAWHLRLNRLNQHEAELVQRWPKMRSWIARVRAGEGVTHPPVNHAVLGPVYRPHEFSNRPTPAQLAREPEALRPWIYRIDGRYVYLSEGLFPRPSGLRYQPQELQAGAKRLASLLAQLPPFYAHFGGAGDALLLLASFYDRSPDGIIFSHPNGVSAARALFDAFPKLSKIYFLPQHAEPFFHIVLRYMVYELRNCLGAGTTPKDNYDEEWKAGLDIEKKYRIKKTPRWAADFRKNSGARKVGVAPKGSLSGMVGSKRNLILPEMWPQVLQHILERGFEPVILGVPGEAKEYPALPGCADARGESFTGQMRVIGECAGLVGADSWAKTFSALAEIPTLVFEPIKGADLCSWKDASDWVFIEPWPAIKMIRSLEDFRRVFDVRIAKIPGAPEPDTSKAVIAWQGSFLDYGSLSHVNRELTSRLASKLNLTRVGSNTLAASAKSDPAMQRLAQKIAPKAPAAAVTVRHQWPPNWSKPASGLLVVIQPWEFGALPKAWVANEKNVDEFWVPSPLVRAMYVNSGIAPEKVRVVPNGVDTKKFRPGAAPLKLATKKKFKFLFVGGTIFRKGPDILLQSFLQAFTAADNVCLVVKDFGGDSFYQGQTAEAAIRASQQKPDAPEIIYLKEELSAEQMPSLYAACDCLVLPYRGEGFGMPVLEAMACGLPVIVTSGGATESFVSPDAGWFIPSKAIRLGDRVGDIQLVKDGWMLEPSQPHLTTILKSAASRPDECRKRGANGRATAEKKFDWNDIAAAVAHRLQELAQRAPVPASAKVSSATASAPKPVLPAVAHVGQLDEARELFGQKNFEAAWKSAVTASAHRPFHPEAFMLLAEIALAAGDANSARQCAQRAREFAPGWNVPKQFLKKQFKGNAKFEWLKLPEPKQGRLSVCLIVKNEEKFLAQCLKSVRDLAHQIIVVDTGSTDRTVEIAKEFGAEIYAHAWADDFAAARNAALEHATGEWVLVLDADEELPVAQHAKLLADLKKSDTMGYRLPLVNRGQEAEGQSFVPRLFRNAPGVYYFGRIHEQVFPSLLPLCQTWSLRTALGTAQLLHHGYSKEMVRDRNKVERNLKLLQLAIAENPSDVNLVMNLGLELVRSDNLAGGVEKYREAFQMMSAQAAEKIVPELREVLLTQFTSQLYKLRAHDEVVDVLNSPLAKKGGLTASLHFALGLSQFELKNFSEAVTQMRDCLAKRKQPTLSPINTEIHGVAPQHCLALSLAKLGERAGAEKVFAAALAEPGDLETVKLDYAKFLAEGDREIEALQKLNEVVEKNPRHLLAWRAGGQIALSKLEFLEFARDWTGAAFQALPENAAIVAQRAEALMLSGDAAAALELWEKIWDGSRSSVALAALILCEAVERPTTHAPDEGPDELAASREFIAWYQRLIKFHSRPLLERVNERLEKISRALPTATKMIEAALTETTAAR